MSFNKLTISFNDIRGGGTIEKDKSIYTYKRDKGSRNKAVIF